MGRITAMTPSEKASVRAGVSFCRKTAGMVMWEHYTTGKRGFVAWKTMILGWGCQMR